MSLFAFKAVLIGILSGYLSGQLGVGGGAISTPALRLILSSSPLIALGTPLPVIIPTAVTGACVYYRENYVDVRLALLLAVPGVAGVVLGAAATVLVSGHLLMLITALIIFLLGIKFLILAAKKAIVSSIQLTKLNLQRFNKSGTALFVGFCCGFFSGFLGLGGGFLLVPALSIIFKREMKEAFGTSLTVIATYAIPGSVVHYLLNHIDLRAMLLLILGVIPGAYLGSKVAIKLSEQTLRFLFGLFLVVIACYFSYFEISNWGI